MGDEPGGHERNVHGLARRRKWIDDEHDRVGDGGAAAAPTVHDEGAATSHRRKTTRRRVRHLQPHVPSGRREGDPPATPDGPHRPEQGGGDGGGPWLPDP